MGIYIIIGGDMISKRVPITLQNLMYLLQQWLQNRSNLDVPAILATIFAAQIYIQYACDQHVMTCDYESTNSKPAILEFMKYIKVQRGE